MAITPITEGTIKTWNSTDQAYADTLLLAVSTTKVVGHPEAESLLLDTRDRVFQGRKRAMQRHKFRKQFKVEAVRLVRAGGVRVVQASRDIAVHENVLSQMVKEFGADPKQAFP